MQQNTVVKAAGWEAGGCEFALHMKASWVTFFQPGLPHRAVVGRQEEEGVLCMFAALSYY